MVEFRLQHFIHTWRAMTLSYHLGYLKTILVHLTRRQSFAGKSDWTFCNIWDCVICAMSVSSLAALSNPGIGNLWFRWGLTITLCLLEWATQLKPFIEQGKDQSMLAQSPYSVTLVIVLYVIINHYQLQMTIQALILLSAWAKDFTRLSNISYFPLWHFDMTWVDFHMFWSEDG